MNCTILFAYDVQFCYIKVYHALLGMGFLRVFWHFALANSLRMDRTTRSFLHI